VYLCDAFKKCHIQRDLACQPPLGSFELKLLKIWEIFKYLNSLSLRDTWYRYFRKNASKKPGDNGSFLNIPITIAIIALTNITLIGEVPLEPVFFEHVAEVRNSPKSLKILSKY
jgi:hypothetical protein